MEENALDNSSSDISINHTNTTEKRISLISIILVILILSVILYVTCKIIFKKNAFDLSKEAFVLSDKTTLLFLDSENYALEYDVIDEKVKMTGRYRFTYGDNVNENIKYEYKTYIQDFKKEDYVLGFLELQNENLYINNKKSENGYNNTYYLLMIYFENGKIEFSGYNIDTGIRVEFKNEKEKFEQYYKQIENTV